MNQKDVDTIVDGLVPVLREVIDGAVAAIDARLNCLEARELDAIAKAVGHELTRKFFDDFDTRVAEFKPPATFRRGA